MSTPKIKTAVTLAAIMLVAFVFLFSGTGITAAVATKSLPGDSLYKFKTGVESTRLNITSQEVRLVKLNLKYARMRLDEIERLIAKGRVDNLAEAIQWYEYYVQNGISNLAVVAKIDPPAALELNSQLASLLGEASEALAGHAAALPTLNQTPFTSAINFSESAGNFKCKVGFTGSVDAVESEYWIISGYKVNIAMSTEIEDHIRIGDKVKVEAWTDRQANFYAKQIYLDDGDPFNFDDENDMEFLGLMDEIQGDYWMINGQRFEIITNTEFKDNIKVGDMVDVEYRSDKNGKLVLLEVGFAFGSDGMDDNDKDVMGNDAYDVVYRNGEQYCIGEINGVISGNIYVAKGETCTLNGAKIEGNIIVKSNAVLFVYSSSLEGNLEASYSSQVEVHINSYISGNVVIYNSGLVMVDYSQINGNLELKNNSGLIIIKDNSIDGSLICYDNYTLPTGGNNKVEGNKEGQCGGL